MNPKLKQAVLEIGYDNGIINSWNWESQYLGDVERFLKTVNQSDLKQLVKFLETLSDEEIETLCCGEVAEQSNLELRAPLSENGSGYKPVTYLLNDIFKTC